MTNLELLVLIGGSILIPLFSILAAKMEWKLWETCRQRDSCRQMQRQITMGKSHCR